MAGVSWPLPIPIVLDDSSLAFAPTLHLLLDPYGFFRFASNAAGRGDLGL